MDTIIETVVQVVATLFITLIGVFGAWLTAKLAERTKLQNLRIATEDVISAAQITVGELQQTVVNALKAGHKDGKLTEDEIAVLGEELLTKTKQKLAGPTLSVLMAAAVDVNAIITGAGENWVLKLKEG